MPKRTAETTTAPETAHEGFTKEQALYFFSYGDIDTDPKSLAATMETLEANPNAKRYAKSLVKLSETYGKETVFEAAKVLRQDYLEKMQDIGMESSRYGQSISWAMWDLAKQHYLSEHPDKSDASKYTLANPMLDTPAAQAARDEIVARHIGWEYSVASFDSDFKIPLAVDRKVALDKIEAERAAEGRAYHSYEFTEMGKTLIDGITDPETPGDDGLTDAEWVDAEIARENAEKAAAKAERRAERKERNAERREKVAAWGKRVGQAAVVNFHVARQVGFGAFIKQAAADARDRAGNFMNDKWMKPFLERREAAKTRKQERLDAKAEKREARQKLIGEKVARILANNPNAAEKKVEKDAKESVGNKLKRIGGAAWRGLTTRPSEDGKDFWADLDKKVADLKLKEKAFDGYETVKNGVNKFLADRNREFIIARQIAEQRKHARGRRREARERLMNIKVNEYKARVAERTPA